jgi:hypothetical protein
MRKLHVGTNPLTNGEPVIVTYNGNPKYEITVREL